MISATAPGKIILFGEHAVVYGRPALAVPVTQVQATATISPYPGPGIRVSAPDISLHSALSDLPADHPLAAVINLFFSTCAPAYSSHLESKGFMLTITSTIPVASGLGSGAAVSVAVIRSLLKFLECPLSDEQVSALAYEVEKLHHGAPSGIDNTVVTYAKPVYFIRDAPIKTFHVGAPFTVVIADTGISALTKESVGDVRRLWEADRAGWERVFDEIGVIVDLAMERIGNGEWEQLGPLMDRNHSLLQTLSVSCASLDRLVETAHRCGALGAKMSGGGRGGNMIALVHPDQAGSVAQALQFAGARRTIVTTIG